MLAHLAARPDSRRALEDIAWALLNSKEFLFQKVAEPASRIRQKRHDRSRSKMTDPTTSLRGERGGLLEAGVATISARGAFITSGIDRWFDARVAPASQARLLVLWRPALSHHHFPPSHLASFSAQEPFSHLHHGL